ncbi:unnamed protein product, partial [Rotaria sp. Silwood2]
MNKVRLSHRSPFRFRFKDAVIIEQEPSSSPPLPPASRPSPPHPSPKETKQKISAPSSTKRRGRFIELKKITKTSSSNVTSRKIVNVTLINDTLGSSLVRRTSGLKDFIHKFDVVPPKSKRVVIDNVSSTETNQDEKITSDHLIDDQQRASTKPIGTPDLLKNVEKDPPTTLTKPILRHLDSSKQTVSFDSTA